MTILFAIVYDICHSLWYGIINYLSKFISFLNTNCRFYPCIENIAGLMGSYGSLGKRRENQMYLKHAVFYNREESNK